MARRLTIVRHAKSDWHDFSLADIDRPLNARGLRDTPAMGRRLQERGDAPDRIICSPALRARTTAQMLAEALGHPLERMQVEEAIYEAPVSALLEVVQACSNDLAHVMMVGHNPGSEQFVRFLTGESPGNFVTCAVADLDLEVGSWAEVGPATATLRSFWYPKMFKS